MLGLISIREKGIVMVRDNHAIQYKTKSIDSKLDHYWDNCLRRVSMAPFK